MAAITIMTGLSGVGKSWMLAQVMHDINGQLLSASGLIAAELKRRGERTIEHDTLRKHDIEENQKALAIGFAREIDPSCDLIVLDAHVVVDTPKGVQFISAEVFSGINPDLFIFIEDDPERILQNRAKDRTRKRPFRDAKRLSKQQIAAKSAAKRIAKELQIAFHAIRAGDIATLKNVLQTQEGTI